MCLASQIQGMTNNVGLTFSVGDTKHYNALVLSSIIRIGDTKYFM